MKKYCPCCFRLFYGSKNQIYCSKKHGYIFRNYGQIQNYPPYIKRKKEIEENGYEVLEANAESVTFEDDDEEQYVACVGGTERTMYIESIREA